MATLKVNAHEAKPLKHLAYPCQIFGVNEHILSNCPKFNKMKHVKKTKEIKLLKTIYS